MAAARGYLRHGRALLLRGHEPVQTRVWRSLSPGSHSLMEHGQSPASGANGHHVEPDFVEHVWERDDLYEAVIEASWRCNRCGTVRFERSNDGGWPPAADPATRPEGKPSAARVPAPLVGQKTPDWKRYPCSEGEEPGRSSA
jgi:hypothetical protein